MHPIPALRTIYVPVRTFNWSDLLVLPLVVRIGRAHCIWRKFQRYRSAELAARTDIEHKAAWGDFPQLGAYERRISACLARSFRFPSDLLVPNDCCDSIFTSDDDVDDCYRAVLAVEISERVDLPDEFWQSFPDDRPYHEFVALFSNPKTQKPAG